jgi:predicted phage terminase large subunit-like protein
MSAAAKVECEWTPELFEHLTDEERLIAEQLLENRFGEQCLGEFITLQYPIEPPPLHVNPIIELIERARHERIKVCLSLPPRHGKTVTILRGIVWWLLHNPADTCAYYSYSDTQAKKKSRVCRDWAREAGIALNPEADNMGEWRTGQGGGLLAGGLQSGLTGMGVSGLFIVDDPFKNRTEADSELIRDKVWDNFNEVVFTRLEGASVIVVHTRWHEDDLIGRLTRQDDPWEYVNIPAIAANDNDILGREEGECLWPGRFDIEELLSIKKQIGTRSFSALYQGSPTSPGGNIIKREWIRYYDELPSGLTDIQQSWDLTFKGEDQKKSKTSDGKKGSYTVGQCWGRKGADVYLIDQYRGRPNFPQAMEAIKAFSKKHPRAIRKLVEDAANGSAMVATLYEKVPGLVLVATKGQSKTERLHLVTPLFEAGNVWLPRWCEELVEELVQFPKAANDDQVDALSMSLNHYLVSFFTDLDLDLGFGLKTENWRY